MAVDAANELAFLAAAARRSIEDVRRTVRASPVRPKGRGSQFLEVVTTTLDALEARVGEREQEFNSATDPADRASALRKMRRTNHDVMAFHSYTPWIESATASKLGLGLTYFVNTMVERLMKHHADIVMTPSTDYMYETTYKPFEPALRRLGKTYPPGVPPIIIAYPVQEPDSLFLHLIIAHELGHSVIYEKKLDAQVFARDPDKAATQALLNQAVDEYINIEGVKRARATAKVSTILRSWVTELICDGIGLGLLGPSFILTAATFSTPFGGPEPGETHPPFTLRTSFLVGRADTWGWRELLTAEVPATFAWIEGRGQLPQQPGGMTYFLTLERVVKALEPTLEVVIADHLGDDRFHPDEYEDADGQPAKELRELLSHNVLPVQLPDLSAADGRAIILAGWLHALAETTDEPASLVKIIADSGFQGFLTKALEMATLVERWGEL